MQIFKKLIGSKIKYQYIKGISMIAFLLNCPFHGLLIHIPKIYNLNLNFLKLIYRPRPPAPDKANLWKYTLWPFLEAFLVPKPEQDMELAPRCLWQEFRSMFFTKVRKPRSMFISLLSDDQHYIKRFLFFSECSVSRFVRGVIFTCDIIATA